MSRGIVIVLLLIGVPVLTSCAESFHQIQRETDVLGIPSDLEKQVDTSVSFADLQTNADNYVGRIVAVGGIVLAAKRTKERTEIEILQLPSNGSKISTTERFRSEGRFFAVRNEFLDPATVPAGTPVTVIGAVAGSTTRLLDESEYLYPILEIKHLIDWNTVPSQESVTRPSAFFYGSYYYPFSYWGVPYGYYPYRGRSYPHFIRPRPMSPPPPPPAKVHPRLRRR